MGPLHPGSQIHVSSLSQLNLTSIWLLIFASRLHPRNISLPSRSTKLHLSSIHASSQTHTGFKMSPYPRLSISPQSRSHLNPIQALRFTSLSQLNLTSIWFMIFASRLHPGSISPPSSSTKLHPSSTQASFQTHTGFKMCVSPPPRSFLNWRVVSQLHPSPISPYTRLKMCISTQSWSHLNPIQV